MYQKCIKMPSAISKLPTTKLTLDTRYKGDEKDRQFPVRLRVTHDQVHTYFATGHKYTKADWKKVENDPPAELQELRSKAKKIIENLKPFSVDLFKKRFVGTGDMNSLKDQFNSYIKELWEGEQVKTARGYTSAINSLELFRPGLKLESITIPFLKEYSKWMATKEFSRTTISMYTRCLRTIINRAISTGDFTMPYPFGKNGFDIPSPKKKKKALTPDQLDQLLEYAGPQQRAKDLWLFCYYCGGRNPIDIFTMKWDQVKKAHIIFPVRQKTKNTDPDQEPILIHIDEDIREILEKWGNPKSEYVFGELRPKMDALQISDQVGLAIRVLNRGLAKIAEELEFNCKPTMGYARCSAANDLRRAGVGMAELSQILAHKSEKTTTIYLQSLEDEKISSALSKLPRRKRKTA
jgi:integrase